MSETRTFHEVSDDLFDRFIKGNRDALGDFLEVVRRPVLWHLIACGYRAENILDAMQDAAIDFLRKTPRWNIGGRASAYSFFLSVMKRMLFDAWKKRGRKTVCFSQLEKDEDDWNPIDITVCYDKSVEESRPPCCLNEIVSMAIETLTPKQREIVHLCFDWGLSPQNAAKELGVCTRAVDSQLDCIGKKLRKNPAICSAFGLDPPSKRAACVRPPASELSEKQWSVVRLVHDQGKSYGEAARLLNMDRAAVRSVWRRACGRIAKSRRLQELTGIVTANMA